MFNGVRMKKILVIFIICLFISINISFSSAESYTKNEKNILYVGGTGPGNYSTIQKAINDAISDNVIFVYSGVYTENLVIDIDSITLRGEDKNTTIIDGDNNGPVVKILSHSVKITNFNITNGNDNGIELSYLSDSNHHTLIENNIIYNCGRGIYIGFNSHNNSILKNEINNIKYQGITLYAKNNIVSDNLIKKCWKSAINCCTDKCTIQRNTFINNSDGIDLAGTNNIIQYNTFESNNYSGIHGFYDDCQISDNVLINDGIELVASKYNTLENNEFYNSGFSLHESYENDFYSNKVNNKPVIYQYEQSDNTINFEAGQIILVNCSNIKVQNIKISDTSNGIILSSCENCEIIKNSLENNLNGIHVENSKNCLINDCIFTNNFCGISIDKSYSFEIKSNIILNPDRGHGLSLDFVQDTLVADNKISYCSTGIFLQNINDCYIIDNNIDENFNGIALEDTFHSFEIMNIIKNNTISNNSYSAIFLFDSCINKIIENNFINNQYGLTLAGYCNDNEFYHNNFLSRYDNVFLQDLDIRSENIWDNGSAGNYWNDYKGWDKNRDGIGDKPYRINIKNQDNYPWMKQNGEAKSQSKSDINNIEYKSITLRGLIKSLIVGFLEFLQELKFLLIL